MRFFLCPVLFIFSVLSIGAQDEVEIWSPESPVREAGIDSDWVKLTNGEWLKGELVSLRNDILIFDSDEFDMWSLDWDDVAEFHSVGDVAIVFRDGKIVTSRISIIADAVVLYNTNEIVERTGILSIVPVKASWWELWNGKLSLGLNVRSGNSNQSDLQIQMNAINRTAFHKLHLSYLGNFSLVENTTITSNNFATFSWNYFFNDQIFFIPVAYNFYNDLLKNIRQQHTPSIGFGYEILNLSTLEWDVTGGFGYQFIQYESVESGEDDISQSYIIQLGTMFTVDITDTTGLDLSYTAALDLIDIRSTNHTFLSVLSVDITRNLELDLTFTWGRVGNPKPREDGSIPRKDDFSLSAGIGFDF